MNLNDASGGDIEPQQYWFESKLTQVSVPHSQPHCTPPNAGGRFLLSSLQSPNGALYYIIVNYAYARAAEYIVIIQLIGEFLS